MVQRRPLPVAFFTPYTGDGTNYNLSLTTAQLAAVYWRVKAAQLSVATHDGGTFPLFGSTTKAYGQIANLLASDPLYDPDHSVVDIPGIVADANGYYYGILKDWTSAPSGGPSEYVSADFFTSRWGETAWSYPNTERDLSHGFTNGDHISQVYYDRIDTLDPTTVFEDADAQVQVPADEDIAETWWSALHLGFDRANESHRFAVSVVLRDAPGGIPVIENISSTTGTAEVQFFPSVMNGVVIYADSANAGAKIDVPATGGFWPYAGKYDPDTGALV